MGGRDKGLIALDGRPLIEHVIQGIAPQVQPLYINANRNLSTYAGFGLPVIRDRSDDFAGPLAGMLAALEACQTPLLLCVPCDGPWLPPDLAQRLLQGLRAQTAEIACAHDGERLHPVFALLDRRLRQPLADYLDAGGRGVQRWMHGRRLAQVDFSDCPRLFVNINTQETLEAVARRLAERR